MASKVPRHTRNRQNTQYAVPSTVASSSLVWALGRRNLGKAALLTDHNAQAWPIATATLGHWAAGQPCSQSVL